MENFKWRVVVRAIAHVELYLTAAIVMALPLLFVGLGTITVNAVEDLKERMIACDEIFNGPPIAVVPVDFVALWILLILLSAVVIWDHWATNLLLRATSRNTDFYKAQKRAKYWRNVAVSNFIVLLAFLYFVSQYLWLAVGAIIRAGCIFLVCKFIDELNTAKNAIRMQPGIPNQTLKIRLRLPSKENC